MGKVKHIVTAIILGCTAAAACPANAATINLQCSGDFGPYQVQVDAITGAVSIYGGAFNQPKTFAGVPWVDNQKQLWVKAGSGSRGNFLTVLTSLAGSSVAWRNAAGRIEAEDSCQ